MSVQSPPTSTEACRREHQSAFAGLGTTEFAMPRVAVGPILALGAEGKGSVCFYQGSCAEMVSGLGNLAQPGPFRTFHRHVKELLERAGEGPLLIAHDLHPSYLSTRLAQSLGRPCLPVQHHHAHAMTVLAEHDVKTPALALVCDGAGYGSDGMIWGCELLACRGAAFDRMGHHVTFPLLGGDAASIETWRPAAALLQAAYGDAWPRDAVGRLGSNVLSDISRLVARRAVVRPSLLTSSLGRIFDAVASLLGLCNRNDREGQAAGALQSAAAGCIGPSYAYETALDAQHIRMSLIPSIRGVVEDILERRDVAEVAARFHGTVANMLAAAARIAADRTGIRLVALAGGCFTNSLLRECVITRLAAARLEVLTPRRTSYGDECLALGQAVIGAAHTAAGFSAGANGRKER